MFYDDDDDFNYQPFDPTDTFHAEDPVHNDGGGDDFALDPNCFAIIPTTPDLTMNSEEDETDKSRSEPSTSFSVPSALQFPPSYDRFRLKNTSREMHSTPEVDLQVQVEEEVDDFAELDAWLQSSAVEIIP